MHLCGLSLLVFMVASRHSLLNLKGLNIGLVITKFIFIYYITIFLSVKYWTSTYCIYQTQLYFLARPLNQMHG